AVLDPEGQRLPERGDLVVRPALAEVPRRALGEIADEIQEARDRVAIGVVVAGEEVERPVAADGLGGTRSDAEVALEAGIPLDRPVVRWPLEVRDHGVDQTVGAEATMQEVAAEPDHAEASRLRHQLVAERPDLVRPALAHLLRPADGRGEPLAS